MNGALARRARALALLALCAALPLALLVRTRPEVADLRAPVDARAASETAWHLRRIELASAQADLNAPDRMLHPEGLRAPWPPLYASALALARELAPRRAQDGLLAWSGPVLGTLAALAAGLAAALAAGAAPLPLRWALAACAAALVAVDPLLVESGLRARLAPAPASALLFAVECALCAYAARARARLDLSLGALAAGVCGAGLALLSVPGAIAAGALALLWCAAALGARAERARELTRAALLHVLALAAVLAQPARHAAFEGGRALAGGALAAFLPNALLALAAGLLAAWAVGTRWPRARVLCALSVAALVGAWLQLEDSRGLHAASALAADRAAAAAELGAQLGAQCGTQRGVLAAWSHFAESGLLAPLAGIVLALIVARVQRGRAGRGAAEPESREDVAARAARAAQGCAIASLAMLATGSLHQLLRRPAAELAAGARATQARAQVLERLREATPASGSSHAPASAHDYAVLAPRGAQTLLAWHARRAAAGPEMRAQFEAQLARGEGAAALRALELAGVRALVLEEPVAEELERQLAAAGAVARAWILSSADWRALALQTKAPGSEPAPSASFEAGR